MKVIVRRVQNKGSIIPMSDMENMSFGRIVTTDVPEDRGIVVFAIRLRGVSDVHVTIIKLSTMAIMYYRSFENVKVQPIVCEVVISPSFGAGSTGVFDYKRALNNENLYAELVRLIPKDKFRTLTFDIPGGRIFDGEYQHLLPGSILQRGWDRRAYIILGQCKRSSIYFAEDINPEPLLAGHIDMLGYIGNISEYLPEYILKERV